MNILKRILNSFIFWGAWIIIPVLMEILPSLGSLFMLIKRRLQGFVRDPKPVVYPEISLIIPVYNSADTLYSCISSVYNGTYPADRIRVFLVNNRSQDNSFEVYAQCQEHFPELKMQWLDAEQGKSRAMNLALYNSEGKYIINLDSDGVLEPAALTNMVNKFEAHPDLNCMTGAILTRPDKVRSYRGFFARLLRQLEFVEYAQAFLAGRSYASELNAVYTLSGAFSAFRKSSVLKSWMYNTDTVCEDTHITFQLRRRQGERVEVCENAIFFVDPIESVNKLYTQRQRWQRGSLEVAQMFMDKNFRLRRVFSDVNVKTLLYDHTFAFPRLIWYLALICMMCMNYSTKVIAWSTGMIFALYIAVGVFYFITVAVFLRMEPRLRRFYLSLWWCVPILPFFNLAVFFIRMAGIINSIQTDSAWRQRDLTQEREALNGVLRGDASRPLRALNRVRSLVNRERPSQTGEPEGFYGPGWYFSVGLLLVSGAGLIYLVYWSRNTFHVEIDEIIATLRGPLQGTGGGMMKEVLESFVLPLGLFALGCVIPFLFVVIISFSSEESIRTIGYSFVPQEWSLETYQYAFEKLPQIWRSFFNSIFITVVGTVLSTAMCALYSYALYRPDFKFRNFFTFFSFFTMIFSGGLVPSYIINTQYLHLTDKLAALILPTLINVFHIIMLRTFFKQLPESLFEAAKMDGASEYHIFFRIAIPLSKPVIATVAFLGALIKWNEWYNAMLYIRNDELVPLQYMLQRMMNNLRSLLDAMQNAPAMVNIQDLPGENLRMAMLVVAIGPMMLVFPFFQKYFTRGMTVGAVKG